jgi:hypothetical protein
MLFQSVVEARLRQSARPILKRCPGRDWGIVIVGSDEDVLFSPEAGASYLAPLQEQAQAAG